MAGRKQTKAAVDQRREVVYNTALMEGWSRTMAHRLALQFGVTVRQIERDYQNHRRDTRQSLTAEDRESQRLDSLCRIRNIRRRAALATRCGGCIGQGCVECGQTGVTNTRHVAALLRVELAAEQQIAALLGLDQLPAAPLSGGLIDIDRLKKKFRQVMPYADIE